VGSHGIAKSKPDGNVKMNFRERKPAAVKAVSSRKAAAVVGDAVADLFPDSSPKGTRARFEESRANASARKADETLTVGSLLDEIDMELDTLTVSNKSKSAVVGNKYTVGARPVSGKSVSPVCVPGVAGEKEIAPFMALAVGESEADSSKNETLVRSQENLPSLLMNPVLPVSPVEIEESLLYKLSKVYPWLLNSLRFEKGVALFSDGKEDLVLCALGIETQFALCKTVPELRVAQGYVLCEKRAHLQGKPLVRFLIVV
jgi:hypothetical protein